MRNTNFTRFVVGVVGNVIPGRLFLSLIPTFKQIWKKKDVEAFDPKLHLATVMNCLLWCYYGLPFVTPNNILVVTINGARLIIELVYLAMFCYYASEKRRKSVSKCLVCEVVCFAATVAATMLGIPGHKMAMNRPLRAYVVGCCDAYIVSMCASSSLILGKVIKTNSVKDKSFTLSLANFVNSCCWTAYALIGHVDYFILLSNGVGVIVGLVQLIVYAIYWRRGTPKRKLD